MTEVGDGVYAFTHQTFMEYFFARHLDGKFDTVEELLEELYPRIVAQQWDVVAHLALQLKTHGNIRKQDEALTWLSARVSRYKAKRHNVTLKNFASRSLEYLSGTEGVLRKLLVNLAKVPDSYKDSEIFNHLEMLDYAIRASRQRHTFVKSTLIDILSSNLLQEGLYGSILRHRLGPVKMGENQRPIRRYRFSPSIASEIREEAKARVETFAKADGDFAALSLQWYGSYENGAILKFGAKAFDTDYLPETPTMGISWIALASHSSYSELFCHSSCNASTLSTVLEELGKSDGIDLLRGYETIRPNGGIVPYGVWNEVLGKKKIQNPMENGRIRAAILDHPELLVETKTMKKGDSRFSDWKARRELQRRVERTIAEGEVNHDFANQIRKLMS